MSSTTTSSDIFERESEILGFFKSQDIVLSANRLCDFVTDFCESTDWRKDCVIYCNRASNIIAAEKRKKFSSYSEFQNMVTALLYEMMDLLETIVQEITSMKAAA